MNQLSGAGLFLVLGAVTAACGSSGSAFTSGEPSGGGSASGGASGGSSAGTGDASSGTGNAGASAGGSSNGTSGAGGSDAGGNGGSSAGASGSGVGGGAAGVGGGSAGAGGGPMCPTVTGYYATITTEGAGCGDYDSSVPACAAPGVEVCRFRVKGNGGKSIDGSLGVKANGTFEGAMVTEGSATRTGCVGTFSPDSGVLTVACGGTDVTSGQFCRIKLTRTADACP